MTADDKKDLFNLLETAYAYMNTTAKRQCPQFIDDAESHSTTMENIAQQIATCQRCQLSQNRHYPVPGNGVAHPLVLIIGEGPGQDEDISGQPFVGRAGQLLDKMMAAIQLSKTTNIFITNSVKCRPPNNRDPEVQESDACKSWLDSQIVLLQPKTIITLGKVASHNLLGVTDTMSNLHGNFFTYRGIPVMPTYHPSALLRNEELKRPAWEDLKIFRATILQIAPGYTEPGYYTNPENIPKMAYPNGSAFNQFKQKITQYDN